MSGMRAALCLCILGLGCGAAAAQTPEVCPEFVPFDIRAHILGKIDFPELHDDTLPNGTALEIDCKDRYCVQHNSYTRQPDWVIERLTPSIVCGSNKRPNGWSANPDVSNPATDNDYKHSGYARGHNAASADFKADLDWMKQTFFFSNAVPQIQDGFNGSFWKYLEEDVQNLARSGADLLVITGPVPADPDGREIVVPASRNGCNRDIRLAGISKLKKLRICDANDGTSTGDCGDTGVAVPAGMFKIVYMPDQGRVFAFVMSNEDHRPLRSRKLSNSEYYATWQVSLGVIEELTNLTLLANLSARERRQKLMECTAWRNRL